MTDAQYDQDDLQRPGRPRVGDTKRGPSPTLRGRVSDADYAAFQKLEKVTGRTQSDLVREGVQLLLAKHNMSDPK